MSGIIYHHVADAEGNQSLTVFADGEPIIITNQHPNFDAALAEATGDDPDTGRLRELTDIEATIAAALEPLSERISVSLGRVYFDGDEVNSSLANHLVRALAGEGDTPWEAIVAFWEKIATNPDAHSREQLFDWLQSHRFTINGDGDIIGYKGVVRDGDENLVSGWTGVAYVDGVEHKGRIPNAVGSTITMPRGAVAHDPSAACSTGLHVGTFDYAQAYAKGAMLKVAVNPRDVVSVPTDAGGEKVRVCRYTVLEIIEAPDTAAVVTFNVQQAPKPRDCDEECWCEDCEAYCFCAGAGEDGCCA